MTSSNPPGLGHDPTRLPVTTPREVTQEAVGRIQAELDRKPNKPMAFVPAAWDALEDAAAEHLGSVGLGAVARARREDLSSVDVVHISRANEAAGGTSRGATLISILNSLGGVITGVGLGLLIALFNRPAGATPPRTPEILFAVIPSLAGGVMLAIAVTLQVTSARRR